MTVAIGVVVVIALFVLIFLGASVRVLREYERGVIFRLGRLIAQKRGGQIAFLGVNSNDSNGSAETFLSELPLPYPSYTDPDLHIAQDLGGPPQAFPTTSFYDRSGKLVFTHPGVYQDESDLVADVNKYASGG